MKVEIDECTGLTLFGCIVIICIATMAINGCNVVEKTKQVAMQSGMSEVAIPSTHTRGWVSKQQNTNN